MDKIQLNLLLKIRKYFLILNNYNYKPKYNSIFYLASYSNFIGSYVLKKIANIQNNNFLKNFIIILKDIIFSLKYMNHSLYFNNIPAKYDKLIVTWAFKDNFDQKGNLIDRYLNTNSDKLKNTIWFVVYMSDKIPNKVGKNIILLTRNEKISLNVFKLFKFLISNVIFIFKDLNYFLFSVSNYNFFSVQILNKLKPFLTSELKYLLMPYEGQPFQNNIIAFLKKKKFKTQIIGYIHSPPLALPSNFIYKSFSPDKIILNGKDQIHCFTKLLGWKKSKIKLLPSFRFLKSVTKAKNIIYLPLAVREPQIILRSLEYLTRNNYINIKNFKTKNHPASFNSEKNLKLIETIQKLKKNNKIDKFKKVKDDYLVFIGNSGGIIEALERGLKVIQIVEFPLFDIYSSKIWPSIMRKKISENIYLYSLRKKGNLIKLGDKKNTIKNLFY